jgi:hypothetical protein
MDDIQNTPGWGIPDDFNDMLNNRSGNQQTSYDEMQDALDDLANDMSMAVDEHKWMELCSGPQKLDR